MTDICCEKCGKKLGYIEDEAVITIEGIFEPPIGADSLEAYCEKCYEEELGVREKLDEVKGTKKKRAASEREQWGGFLKPHPVVFLPKRGSKKGWIEALLEWLEEEQKLFDGGDDCSDTKEPPSRSS